MITSIEIQRIRGIREGRLSDLSRLTILVGRNGTGKSTILDALLLAASVDPRSATTMVVGRRKELAVAYRWLLHRAGDEGAGNVQVTLDNGQVLKTKIALNVRGLPEVTFDPSERSSLPGLRLIEATAGGAHEALHSVYSEATRRGRRDEATAILADVISGFKDVQLLTEENQPVVFVMFRDHGVPVALAGDGMIALVQLAFELASCAGGTVLLEEPEVHQHPGALVRTARVILAACRRGIQVILSTHSIELLDALIAEANDDDLAFLSVYRLALENGLLQSTRIGGADVAFARGQIGDDLR